MPETQEDRSALSRLKTVGLALGFVVVSVACMLVLWRTLSFLGDEKSIVRNTVIGILTLGLVVAATLLAQRWRPTLQRKDLVLVPVVGSRSAPLVFWGLLAGALLFAIVFALVLATGGIHVEWKPIGFLALASVLLTAFFATILNAAWEEYTFRGWPFSVCARALGPHVIAIGLGAAFGLAHLFNPKWTVAAIVSVALAGFLLSYAMLASKNILFPIGMHVGWNFTQSLLTSSRFWEVTKHSNPWLSGGEWGLEGSAIGIGVTALAAAVALTVFLRSEARPSSALGSCVVASTPEPETDGHTIGPRGAA